MPLTPAEPGLEWILIPPDPKGYNTSKVDRRAIRRHAMKKISARWRQSKEYGKVNVGQYPSSAGKGNKALVRPAQHGYSGELDSRILYSDSTRSFSSTSAPPILAEWAFIPPPMPLMGMERVRGLFGIDILSLSPLTITHVGEATSLYFDPPNLLMALLNQQKSSYLCHIPRRFGHNPCLDHAIYALLSKAREILYPHTPKITTIALSEHGKALRMLQRAIDNPASRIQPDVLCITELLGLIEILNLSKKNAWAHHITGASYLLQLRGSASFKSDYEMDLFASLISPIICEAIRKDETCFLQDACWQDALDSLVIPTNGEILGRSGITIFLRKLLAHLPGLFKDVSSVISDPENVPEHGIPSLCVRIHYLRRQLLQHLAQLRAFYADKSPTIQTDMFYELLGTNLTTLTMACRLLSAIGDDQAEALEHDARFYAFEVRKLQTGMISTQGWANFYLDQKTAKAAAILDTAKIWDATPGKIIEKWRFDTWRGALHRHF